MMRHNRSCVCHIHSAQCHTVITAALITYNVINATHATIQRNDLHLMECIPDVQRFPDTIFKVQNHSVSSVTPTSTDNASNQISLVNTQTENTKKTLCQFRHSQISKLPKFVAQSPSVVIKNDLTCWQVS